MRITEITRRAIMDALQIEGISWSGRLEEPEFLGRIFNLQSVASNDPRFRNAAGDIWQHRILNPDDWTDDWIFHDERFNLLHGDDDQFLRFLCETVHPVVRPDPTDAEKLVQLYNQYLSIDGYKIVEKARMSGRPIYAGRYDGQFRAGVEQRTKEVLGAADDTYVAQQITRMEGAIPSDPDLAIGTAKELVETCCKTILQSRNVGMPEKDDLISLVKRTAKELDLNPAEVPSDFGGAGTIKRLLGNLGSITQGIAELRNKYGTGHGKLAGYKGLESRHARLAVGAASTLAVFLMETHQKKKTWVE